jgi:hypothetical protein
MARGMADQGTRVRRRYMFVVMAASGVTACAGILGVDDRSLDPDLSDSAVSVVVEGGADTMGSNDDGGATSFDAPSTPPDGATGIDSPIGSDARTGDAGPPDAPACADPCLLASGLNHPFLMTSDATNVYWTEFGDDQGSGNGFVKACPLSGCGSGPIVYASGLINPRGVAVDSQNIYFGTASYSGTVGGIWACPLSGCNGSPLQLAMAGIPYGVAVDSTFVYWVDNDDNTVHKVAKTGGTDNVLYDAGSGLIVEPGECVVDGPFLFITDANADALRLATTGGEPTLLGTSDYGGQYGITTDPSYVYFGGSGVVLRALKTSGDGGVAIAQSIEDPTGLAFDSESDMIYWSNWGSGNGNDGTVGKMAPDGGAQHLLATALTSPEAVTVSGNYVFWLSNGTLGGSDGTEPSTGALFRSTK